MCEISADNGAQKKAAPVPFRSRWLLLNGFFSRTPVCDRGHGINGGRVIVGLVNAAHRVYLRAKTARLGRGKTHGRLVVFWSQYRV